MYVRIYLCVHINKDIYRSMYARTYYVCTYLRINVRTYMCIHVREYLYMRVRTFVRTFVCANNL
jgi:hypothetical protein